MGGVSLREGFDQLNEILFGPSIVDVVYRTPPSPVLDMGEVNEGEMNKL